MALSSQFESALHIVETLRGKGFEAYLAGGCVRDLLLGREPKDYDVATSATPDVILNMFPRTFAVGAHFGVVLVAASRVAEDLAAPQVAVSPSPGEYVITEVATFRSDGAYSDGRHPDAVRYTTRPEEDVQRRDFTINGLLLDPLRDGGRLDPARTDSASLRSSVLDFVGGLARSGCGHPPRHWRAAPPL